MEIKGITFQNQTITDWETFDKLPVELQNFLKKSNGLVALHGAIQFKGCVFEPTWVSLKEIWMGNSCLFQTYDLLRLTDIPFAQDGFGNQFVWRDSNIFKLDAETGQLTDLGFGFEQLLEKLVENSLEFLGETFIELFEMGIRLEYGQLMQVFPPFIFSTDEPRSFRPIAAVEQIEFLKNIYLQTRHLSEGQTVVFKTA